MPPQFSQRVHSMLNRHASLGAMSARAAAAFATRYQGLYTSLVIAGKRTAEVVLQVPCCEEVLEDQGVAVYDACERDMYVLIIRYD